MTQRKLQITTMRAACLMTAINVVVACGFAVAGLLYSSSVLPEGYAPTAASSIFAMYAAARAVPLALVTLVAIYRGSGSSVLTLGTPAGATQLLDAGVGLYQHDIGKSVGPLAIAVVQFVLMALLQRSRRAAPLA